MKEYHKPEIAPFNKYPPVLWDYSARTENKRNCDSNFFLLNSWGHYGGLPPLRESEKAEGFRALGEDSLFI